MEWNLYRSEMTLYEWKADRLAWVQPYVTDEDIQSVRPTKHNYYNCNRASACNTTCVRRLFVLSKKISRMPTWMYQSTINLDKNPNINYLIVTSSSWSYPPIPPWITQNHHHITLATMNGPQISIKWLIWRYVYLCMISNKWLNAFVKMDATAMIL